MSVVLTGALISDSTSSHGITHLVCTPTLVCCLFDFSGIEILVFNFNNLLKGKTSNAVSHRMLPWTYLWCTNVLWWSSSLQKNRKKYPCSNIWKPQLWRTSKVNYRQQFVLRQIPTRILFTRMVKIVLSKNSFQTQIISIN